MLQIVPIQAAPQPIPTGTAPAKTTPNQFFPHLEKATATTTPATSDTVSYNIDPDTDTAILETAELFTNTHVSFDIDPDTATVHIEKNFFESPNLVNMTDRSIGELGISEEELPDSLWGKISADPFNQPAKEQIILQQNKKWSSPSIQPVFSNLRPEKTDTAPSLQAPANTVDAPLKVAITELSMTDKNNPLPPTSKNQALLLQLQQIISNGNETGTVSIQTSVNNYSLQYHGEEGARSVGIIANQILDPGKFAEKPGSKLPALRQDMQAQYMDAKINAKEQADSWPHTKNNEQQSSANSQQTSTSLQSNSTPVPEQSTGFQHISTLMQELHTNQANSSSKPIVLPSGTVVNEDNVIQQVAERFHINNRANDTKISLQLHPEELGQLKIDLTLKEGAIKVHVIAQSQHVLEIIEKNIIKLRNILEDQGFSIEELTVTSESDSVPDFDLFEQHLSQQRDLPAATIDTQSHKDFDMALEDAVETATDSSTGVNIKV